MTDTPLIEFSLTPLDQLEPGFSTHSWFGLTDGSFHLNVGEQQLYRHSEEYEVELKLRYVDYYVARFYEDILEMLPDILDTVPSDIVSLIASQESQSQWTETLDANYEEVDDDDEDLLDTYSDADLWFCGHRRLDTGYVRGMPAIWIWKVDDQVHIRWQTDTTHEDSAFWAATSGQIELPTDEFLNEIRSFHDRLMGEMNARIEALCARDNLPIEPWMEQHREREAALEKALGNSPQTLEWSHIRSALTQLGFLNAS